MLSAASELAYLQKKERNVNKQDELVLQFNVTVREASGDMQHATNRGWKTFFNFRNWTIHWRCAVRFQNVFYYANFLMESRYLLNFNHTNKKAPFCSSSFFTLLLTRMPFFCIVRIELYHSKLVRKLLRTKASINTFLYIGNVFLWQQKLTNKKLNLKINKMHTGWESKNKLV